MYKSKYSTRLDYMDRIKRIWYLSPMLAAKVLASLRIRAVSPEPPLLAHTSSESRGTFRQKARSLVPLNGRACAVEICHDLMLEDTNSLDEAHIILCSFFFHKFIALHEVCAILYNTHIYLFFVYYKELLKLELSAGPFENGTYHTGKQRRLRQACASVQSRQSIPCLAHKNMQLDKEQEI